MASKLEIPHTIISLNVLATGRMILTTEKRVYELVNEVWTPMKFADDPVVEPATPPAKAGLFSTPTTTPVPLTSHTVTP